MSAFTRPRGGLSSAPSCGEKQYSSDFIDIPLIKAAAKPASESRVRSIREGAVKSAASPDIHSRCWLDLVEPGPVYWGLDLVVFSSSSFQPGSLAPAHHSLGLSPGSISMYECYWKAGQWDLALIIISG
ncbi:hypothetical protein NQZ68_020409 [Dissostichus eleginoides]|nr:hypothetical protein NQZ68_020409 [Dissostichus eleginoides]